MEDFVKNIKKKLSVDNIVDFMKDAKLIDELDERKFKEQKVRDTLNKINPSNLVDDNIMSAKIDLSESAITAIEGIKKKTETLVDDAKTVMGLKGQEHIVENCDDVPTEEPGADLS